MKTLFEQQEIELAESLRAIAHPVRIRILRLLSARPVRKMSVTEIQENLGLSQPETSRHLLTLKLNGILRYVKEGLNVFYSINRDNAVAEGLSALLKNYKL